MKNKILFLILFLFFSGSGPVLHGCKSTVWDDAPRSCQDRRLSIEYNRELLRQKEMSVVAEGGDTTFRTAVISDSHRSLDELEGVIDILNRGSSDIDFILFLGDITQMGLEMEFEWTCKALEGNDLPLFTVIGNHDLLNFGERIWKSVFGPLDYSFSFLGTTFIAYNSNKLEDPDSPDLGFIKQAAQISPGETRNHTIAAAHTPVTDGTVYSAEETEAIQNTLISSGIKLSLHGHQHHFGFDYFADKDLLQYRVSTIQESEYGIMTVSPTDITLENCSENRCSPAVPE